MCRRGVYSLWLLLTVSFGIAGCGERSAMETAACGPALAERGHAVQLFGPTALPRGEEDMGYFAYAEAEPESLLMYDRHAVFVRTWIWDVEDNRRPGRSYHRRRVFSEEIRSSLR